MGPCSNALFHCLTSDLNAALPGINLSPNADVNHLLWPGIDPTGAAAVQLRSSILKKFQDIKEPDASEKAISLFLSNNDKCKNWSLPELYEVDYVILSEVKDTLYHFFYPDDDSIFKMSDILNFTGIGPGASIGATSTDLYSKLFAGKLTTTSRSLYDLYRSYVDYFPLWKEAEKIRSTHYGEESIVKGSRLTCVPKTRKIDRVICTEPLLNMFFQKGIQLCLERRLNQYFGIDLALQPDRNRLSAQLGSIDFEDRCTIDLSSASDLISINLLEYLLPRKFLAWLKIVRSPYTLVNGNYVELHMISSMGNATTFPLQTIIFAAVCKAVAKTMGLQAYTSVFGDDIIVPKQLYSKVIHILEIMGFIVNRDKSYDVGFFRESCGHDYFRGYNVRGVYCTSLKTQQDVLSLFNRLNIWSHNHVIPLPTTLEYLYGFIKRKLFVPPWESVGAGIMVPYDMARRLLPKRRYGTIVYRRWEPRPHKVKMADIRAQHIKINKRKIANHAGILLCAVSGTLRGSFITIRSDRVLYKTRLAYAPCWDYKLTSDSLFTNQGWRVWLDNTLQCDFLWKEITA